jgi:hypothetical protein
LCDPATTKPTAALSPRATSLAAQTEVSQLKGERERLRGSTAAFEGRIEELTREVEAAKQVGDGAAGTPGRQGRGGLTGRLLCVQAGALVQAPDARRTVVRMLQTERQRSQVVCRRVAA